MANQWPLQSECMSYYGDPRQSGWYAARVVEVPCPWALRVGNITTDHIHVHKRCAESLLRVLNKTWIDVGRDVKKIREIHADIYDGCYNFRSMRGRAQLSMHAFACAIDWDAANNPFRSKKFFFRRDTPLIANFIAEGWIWGGEWSVPDAMHVQACRVR